MGKLYCILLISFFFGIANNDARGNDLGKSDAVEVPQEPATWQEQLDFAKQQCDSLTRNGISGLKLVEYRYRGEVKTQEQREKLLQLLFSDDTDVVLHLDENGESYDIVPLKAVREQFSCEPFEMLKLKA